MPVQIENLQESYWEKFEIQEEDLEFLYNHLLEIETPLTAKELAEVLIRERIRREKERLLSLQTAGGEIYQPKKSFQTGERLQFPALNWIKGEVLAIRSGFNPDLPPFEVIKVKMEDGSIKEFAASLTDHVLNQDIRNDAAEPSLNADRILEKYSDQIASLITQTFENVPDLVQIAGAWFPRSLLVDVSVGHLNLAEALLEMSGGGPLPTEVILDQIELPTDVNRKLTEFSMNLALQEDERFDEVGPAGKTLWFLRRLEPEGVQNTPLYLRYQPVSVDTSAARAEIEALNRLVFDELEPEGDLPRKAEEIEVSLIFPHWRSGTIPLSKSIARLFPTAYEAPRVRFLFVDEETGKEFPGWVVRPNRYVFGLREWIEEKELIPGSLFVIKQGKEPGKVIVRALKKKSTKEWLRTVLVGTDGGVVLTMLKQQIANEYDERMAIAIPDVAALDQVWESGSRYKTHLDKTILSMMREMVKLSPQGHVHAQELYAAVNLVRRCPPGVLVSILANQPNVIHLGDLYYRLNDQEPEA
jgi:hypothetical protein